MTKRELAFSVKISDCEVQTFRSGGKGGQHQNKTDSGVRIIHHPSGARGESREERSQLANKKKAFRRMVDSSKFRWWIKQRLDQVESEEAYLSRVMQPENLLIEYKENGKWVEKD